MKIALINGSPQIKACTSSIILQKIKEILGDGQVFSDFHFRRPCLDSEEMERLLKHDVLIFSFPLYVDGVPSHLLNCLIELERHLSSRSSKNIKVYALVNCRLYEGEQTRLALNQVKNWCWRVGLTWGQGMGIGASSLIFALRKSLNGNFPVGKLERSLETFGNNVLYLREEENIYTTVSFPRFLYKFITEMEWRRVLRANGLRKKDLFLKR